MIITDKFNFIHLPKTGGSFVESILLENYKRRSIFQKFLNKYKFKVYHEKINTSETMPLDNFMWGQHGGKQFIPEKYQEKPVLGIVRHPFSWYLSIFHFKYWEIRDDINFEPELNQENLTVDSLFDILSSNLSKYGESIGADYNSIGRYTWVLAHTYMDHPVDFLDQYIKNGCSLNGIKITDYLKNVDFLKQESLSTDLKNILSNYYNNDFNDILKKPRLLPQGQGRGRSEEDYSEINIELKNKIISKEKLIFELFSYLENPQ